MLIAGEWRSAQSEREFQTFDPTTGEPSATIPDGGAEDVDAAVAAAKEAFESSAWRSLNGYGRAALLMQLADLIESHAVELATLETCENGKLLRETTGQARFAARNYRYFAGVADKLLGDVIPLDDSNLLDILTREPVGVCAALLAWNSPLQFAANKLAPALAAGNTVVVKPSEYAATSILEFASLAQQAGFPPGVINVVTGTGANVGRLLSGHPDIDMVSLTGGVATGRAVAAIAAENVTRVALELGGKSPHIVFADADFERAVAGVLAGIFAAAGQTCIAGSRLLLQRSIYDAFVDRLVKAAGSIRLGSPFADSTQMGPLANRPQYDRVLTFIERGLADGAALISGGGPAVVDGFPVGLFVKPTIFAGASNSSFVAREEAFGPVLAVIPFDDEAEAIALANDSPYGLAAGLWTTDLGRGIRVTRAIRAGTVWVNTYRTVSPAAPFGGFRDSGYGRERGLEALRDYTLAKNVIIDTGEGQRDPFVLRT